MVYAFALMDHVEVQIKLTRLCSFKCDVQTQVSKVH